MGQTIGVPQFRESEMSRCSCCFPIASKTIVTADPLGREQYTCPKTRITMRYMAGADTYIGGLLGTSDRGGPAGYGAGQLVDSAGHPLVAGVIK